jgi:hypothetical protein
MSNATTLETLTYHTHFILADISVFEVIFLLFFFKRLA